MSKYAIIEVEDAFVRWLCELGIPPAEGERLSLDGLKHRYRIAGDRARNGEFCVYVDERPAGWAKSYAAKHGVEYAVWSFFRAGEANPWTEEQKREYVQRKEQEREAAARQKEMDRARASAEAARKWEAATPARPDHPYLKAKGLNGTHGARQLGRDLVIPMYNRRGQVINVQTISPRGDKLFLKGAPKMGSFYIIGAAGPTQGGHEVFLCEGFATGATVHEATGRPVAVCWDCGNLAPAAETLRRIYPGQLILAADNDHKTTGNPGIAAAFELSEKFGIPFTAPKFQDGEKGSDWNDYAALNGLEATGEAIFSQLEEARKIPELEKNYTQPRWIHERDNGAPMGTLENLKILLHHENLAVVYDEVKKDIRYNLPGTERRYGPDNRQNAVRAEIVSLCERYRFPTSNLEDFLVAVASENRSNPVKDWMESFGWDGRDRIADLGATLELAEWFPVELKNLLLRRWLVSGAAACESREFKARGVLVLQGAQAIGKTSWFSALVPPGSGWFLDGMALDPEDKDSLKRVISHWIIELGELEATFKKADINKLKSFITSSTDVVRLPWMHKFSEFPRRTVFCASVNQAEFLVDTTGNSRWWCLPCRRINYAHKINMQQVWAEALELYRRGERWWLTKEEEDCLDRLNRYFEAGDEIEDIISGGWDWDHYEEDIAGGLGQWMNATAVLKAGGLLNPSKMQVRRAGEVLRRLTGRDPARRGSSGDRCYLMPGKKGAGLYA